MTLYDVLIVDAQNDFCKPDGALFVPGAPEDAERFCALLDRLDGSGCIGNFHVTMDTHFVLDISHPCFWRDSEGNMPEPYTQINSMDLASGEWLPKDPASRERAAEYLDRLETSGRYTHTIWPEHCILGSPGHCIVDGVMSRINRWERREGRRADFILKGMNLWTEHYSVLRAEVEDPDDPGTGLNRRLLDELTRAEAVIIAGQALSHCVANTITDLIENLAHDVLGRVVLLEDTSSSVPGFEELGRSVLKKASGAGMRVCKAVEVLSS